MSLKHVFVQNAFNLFGDPAEPHFYGFLHFWGSRWDPTNNQKITQMLGGQNLQWGSLLYHLTNQNPGCWVIYTYTLLSIYRDT